MSPLGRPGGAKTANNRLDKNAKEVKRIAMVGMNGKAVAKAIPELKGLLTGNAIRVPTPNVSLAVISLSLSKDVTKESINTFLRKNAFHSKYREIVGYVNSSEIVSTDFYSSPFASIIDSQATIASGNRATLYCWYDNEYGYSKQVINLTKKVANVKLTRLPLPKSN